MSSSLTAAYKISAADYFALPEGPPFFQLIDGALFMSPSPNRYHQDVIRNIGVPLTHHVELQKAGRVYFAPSDVVFTDEHIFQPDLYFVSNERLHILTSQGASGAPDLVVEVLSLGTATLDLGRKREVYEQTGVREFWAVSPEARSIEVYQFVTGSQPTHLLRETDTLTTALLPGFELPLSAVFRA